MSRLTLENVSKLTIEELAAKIEVYFDEDIPKPVADMRLYNWSLAQQQLIFYGQSLATMCGMYGFIKAYMRQIKKSDPEYLLQAAKRDIIEEAKDSLVKKYDALSRAFSIYAEEKVRTPGR